jgi:hypothetical protein
MLLGRASPNYGTHRSQRPDGYIRVWRPGHPLASKGGDVLEHRLVLYEAGRELMANEHVHHINGDKTDNRLENLEIVSEAEHQRIHHHLGSTIVNQYGEWAVVGPEVRRARNLARNLRDRVRRSAALAADPSIRPHGNASTYNNWGCRCEPCRAAERDRRRTL